MLIKSINEIFKLLKNSHLIRFNQGLRFLFFSNFYFRCNTLGDCDHPGPQPTMAGIDHVGHIEVTEGKDGDVKELIDGKIPEEADAKLNNEEAIKQDVGELPPKTEEGTKGDEAETTTAKVETAKDAQEIPPKGGKETAEAEDSPKLD